MKGLFSPDFVGWLGGSPVGHARTHMCGYIHLVGFLEDELSGDSVMTGCLSLWTVVLSFYMIPDPHGGYPGLLTWQLGSKSTCSRE